MKLARERAYRTLLLIHAWINNAKIKGICLFSSLQNHGTDGRVSSGDGPSGQSSLITAFYPLLIHIDPLWSSPLTANHHYSHHNTKSCTWRRKANKTKLSWTLYLKNILLVHPFSLLKERSKRKMYILQIHSFLQIHTLEEHVCKIHLPQPA